MCALSENSRRSAAGFHDEYCEPGGGSVYGGAADFGRLFLVEGDHRGTCAVVRYPLYTFYRTIVRSIVSDTPDLSSQCLNEFADNKWKSIVHTLIVSV